MDNSSTKKLTSRLSQTIAALSCAAALAGLSSTAMGANVTNNVIFGSGNSNGSWTVSTANNVEVGLRAKTRGAGVYNWDGNHTYTQQAGSDGGAALWNFEYSINLRQDGMGPLLWDNTLVTLEVDLDPTAGISWGPAAPLNVSPFSGLLGNSFGDNTTGQGDGVEVSIADANAGQLYLMQNSQNLGFVGIPGLFDPEVQGIYDFRLTVSDASGQLAQTQMQVNAVPIPAAALLFGSALLGLVGVKRRQA